MRLAQSTYPEVGDYLSDGRFHFLLRGPAHLVGAQTQVAIGDQQHVLLG